MNSIRKAVVIATLDRSSTLLINFVMVIVI